MRITIVRWRFLLPVVIAVFVFVNVYLYRYLWRHRERAPLGGLQGDTYTEGAGEQGPSVLDYCNSPRLSVQGEEGEAPPDYQLESVHIIVRHGDRVPLHTLPNYRLPDWSCRISPENRQELRQFMGAMTRSQHKRQPGRAFYHYPLYPNKKRCQPSDLTELGVLQHYHLGTYLRQVYIDTWGLLKPNFMQNEVYIRSTSYNRTFQSAVAFLYAFLPRFEFSTLHIDRASNTRLCSEKYSGMTCHCRATERYSQRIATQEHRHRLNSTELRTIYSELSELFDFGAHNSPWPASIMDVLMGHVCHKKPLPCGPYGCMTSRHVEDVVRYVRSSGQRKSRTADFETLSELESFPLLSEIAARMQRSTRVPRKLRMVLYSGHDTTITPTAAALGIYDGIWPPYGSRIIVELYKKTTSTSTNTFWVRFLYNGKDATGRVRFCRNKTVDNMCPLDSFLQHIKYKSVRLNYARACLSY